uniref:histidine kinase n=1 Tax=Phormidium sp. KS TaxID=654446 RepID=A0A3S5I6U9_9CYAN|nr:CheA signal transduction histidine kinase [Phormidium sp. KS]
MLPEQQQRILGYFIEEAKDHLNTIEQGLLNLQNTIDDQEMVNEMFRAAHSVKGGAAMLGINSIQKTAHRLEDYFKELKEHRIQVDQKLESLFLQVFDTLQALLEQLQGPFGLTEDAAESIMAGADPVFEELKVHLESLLEKPPAVAAKPDRKALEAAFSKDVMEMLRQMLQLFKPPVWPDSRSQLEECCVTLSQMGDRFNLPNWCNLMAMARSAISNPENTAQTLAPVIIKEIKTAQELVIAGRSQEICVCEQLLAMQPAISIAEAEPEISDDIDQLLSFSEEPEIEPITASADEDSFDLFSDIDTVETQENSFDLQDSAPAFWEAETEHHPTQSFGFAPSEERTYDSKFAYPSGPEVGAAELNTLADLFETDIQLDEDWQEEEIINETAVQPIPNVTSELDGETDSEFADLFEDISPATSGQGGIEELDGFDDGIDLFDDTFSQELNSTQIQPIIATAADSEFADLFDDGLDAVSNVELPEARSESGETDSEFADLFDDGLDAVSSAEIPEAQIESGETDSEFGDLFDDVSTPVAPKKAIDEDDFNLLDETIFVENYRLEQPEAQIESLETDSEFGDLFDDVSEPVAPNQITGNDDFSTFDENIFQADNSFDLETKELEEQEAVKKQPASSKSAPPQNGDDLSQLFAGLEEDDLNWEELPPEAEEIESIQSPIEATPENWEIAADEWEMGSEENTQFSMMEGADNFADSEPSLEDSGDLSNLWGDESNLLDVEETNSDWQIDRASAAAEIPELMDLNDDDFDPNSLFGESPTLVQEITDSKQAAIADESPHHDLFGFNTLETESQDLNLGLDEQWFGFDEGELAPPVSIATEKSSPKTNQTQPKQESFDSFFSVQEETQAEFWVDESADDLSLENKSGGVEDLFSTSQDIFADTGSHDLWNIDGDGSIDLFGSSDESATTQAAELWSPNDFTAELDLDGSATAELTPTIAESNFNFDDVGNSYPDLELGIEEEKPIAIGDSTDDGNWDSSVDNLFDDIFAEPSLDEHLASEATIVQDFAVNLDAETAIPELSLDEEDSSAENWLGLDLSDVETDDDDLFAAEPDTPTASAQNDFDFDSDLEENWLGLDLDVGTDNNDLFAAELDTPAASAQNDFDFDSGLLDVADNNGAAEDFGFDELLGFDDAVATSAPSAPPAPKVDSTTNISDAQATPSDDFDELEALLGDDLQLPSNGQSSTVSNSTSNGQATSSGLDEFAELEALLGADAAPAPTVKVAPTPTSAKPTTSSSGFDDFAELERMVADAEPVTNPGGASKSARVSPTVQIKRPQKIWEQTMKVPVKHMDNLSNLVGELVVNRNTLEQDQERLRQCLDNLLNQVQQLSDVGARMQDLYERSLLEASLLASRRNYRSTLGSDSMGTHHTGEDYDPLEMDRFTSFHTLSQEMIELIVRVRESTSDIEFVTDETDQVCRQFRQVSTQLQEGLTRARMVPFGEIERVFPLMRYVRDKAAEFGKQAEIKIEGRETLIDKLILEHFSDPLKHLVNNAIAHGIETPEVRQRIGKSPVGRIVIRAFHQGNQTVITFSDDGAGIDVERVKTKALQKGLITREEAKTMSRHDIYQVIYHPGFSTKDEADSMAGRGVGMDVVLTSLSEIRGTINTDSTQGKGTTFTVRLPLTLSICKALCCLSDKARIAFPMDGVEDALDLEKERIHINEEGNQCIPWRDMMLPFRPLSELLTYNRHLGRGSVYGGNKEDDRISIVVLRSAGTFIALQVDQVLGEQEIVIKQLEGPIPKPLGVAGATVLGDGRIMPIGDVLELIDLSLGRIQSSDKIWRDQTASAALPPEPPKTEPTVLIVDDSITVRELLSMTFNKAGYRVEQARDGQEAWDKLKSGLPCEIVFCDIEMPRMDGLELLSRLQKDGDLNHLPVAMLTSRGADKHRQMAIQLGARGYFTKPYLEEALLDAASRMLKGEVLVTSASNA